MRRKNKTWNVRKPMRRHIRGLSDRVRWQGRGGGEKERREREREKERERERATL